MSRHFALRSWSLSSRAVLGTVLGACLLGPAWATSIAPPMLDITGQCSATARRNVTAMSECIVAESEARAEILQQWGHVSDGNADRCIKAGEKSKRFPYSTIAKCLSEPVAVEPPAAVATKAPAAKASKGKTRRAKASDTAAPTVAPATTATATAATSAPMAPTPTAASNPPTSTFAKWKQFFAK